MTTRQWILVAAALGIGLVAQIPMAHAPDNPDQDMAVRDLAADMAVSGEAMGGIVDIPGGLAQVTFAITGMT